MGYRHRHNVLLRLEVLAANGVETMIQRDDGFTPTPVISHAILTYNRNKKQGSADGIVVTLHIILRKMAVLNITLPMEGLPILK